MTIEKLQRLFYKYYRSPSFKFNFLFLYNCVPNFKYYLTIERVLKNLNVPQLGTGKNSTSGLYSETTKPVKIFGETKDKKKTKNNKIWTCF